MMKEMMPSEEKGKRSESELKHLADILMQAAEIHSDPELMKELEPMLQKKSSAIKSISDIRKMAQSKAKEAMEPKKEEKSESASIEASED